jgi:Xaa-Pro aminopeptidase
MNNIIDLNKLKVDAILLVTPLFNEYNKDILYITGYKGIGYLIIKKLRNKDKIILIVPKMELSKAKRTFKNSISFDKGMKNNIIEQNIKGCKNLGLQFNNISFSQVNEIKKLGNFRFKDVGKELLKIRSIKNKKEIDSITKACRLCDKIFTKIINNFKFKTEKELQNFIIEEIKKEGHETSFTPIVASAKNSSIVHHYPDSKIRKGFLLLDYGAKINGYCSDMSRTIYVGKPNNKEKEIYDKVLFVQEELIKNLKIGIKCSLLYENAKYLLKPYDELFTHGLGHGVGLDIHELPSLHPLSDDKIEENQIITIEPGIYFNEKFGIRIEDSILIKKNKNEILTKSTKKLMSVKQNA